MRHFANVAALQAEVGNEVAVSEWMTIAQERVNQFAAATDDPQWIHVDVERAKNESPFQTTIAHGFLTLSLLAHLAEESVVVKGNFKMGINYGLNRVRFVSPVPSNSRVHGRFTLQAVEDVAGGVQLTWAITVEVEGATKPSLVAEWLVRYYY